MIKNYIFEIIRSWKTCDESVVNSTSEILNWIGSLNESAQVLIKECSINDSTFWFYDDYNGEVLNRKRSFFSIKGMRHYEDGKFKSEQPIIIQP